MAFKVLHDLTPPCFSSLVLVSLTFLAMLFLFQQHVKLFPAFGPWLMYFFLLGTLSHPSFSPSHSQLLFNLTIQPRFYFLHGIFSITLASLGSLAFKPLQNTALCSSTNLTNNWLLYACWVVGCMRTKMGSVLFTGPRTYQMLNKYLLHAWRIIEMVDHPFLKVFFI